MISALMFSHTLSAACGDRVAIAPIVSDLRANVDALVELPVSHSARERANAHVLGVSHEREPAPNNGIVERERAFDILRRFVRISPAGGLVEVLSSR